MFHLAVAATQPETAWSAGVDKLQSTGAGFVAAIPAGLIALSVVALFWFTGWIIRRLARRFATKERKHRNLGLVLGRLAQGLMTVLGVLIAAVIVFPNFTPASLITSLGIGGLALGIAFKDVLENYLAGILMLLTEPFQIGDQIIFGAFEGTVEDIQTRATSIRTYDGRRVVVPNAVLFTEPVIVNTAFDKRRLEYDVGIGYGDDIHNAKRVILEALNTIDSVLKDPVPEVLTYELAGSAVNLRVRWWINPPRRYDYFLARDEVLTALRYKLVDAGVDLPFPTQQILIHDQTEETDGDRRYQREGWPKPTGDARVPRSRAAMFRRTQSDDTPRGTDGE